MTTVGIMQPTYIGWLGYFDMLDAADTFVLLDTVPINRKSWQTRNRILTRDGTPQWLTIPTHAHQGQPLNEVQIANEHDWRRKHIRAIEAAYTHAPYYHELIPLLDQIASRDFTHLSHYTTTCLKTITSILRIETPLIQASALLPTRTTREGRIMDLVRQVEGDTLLDTAGARHVLYVDQLGEIPIRWHDYQHPTYAQGTNTFTPHMSIIDLLAWHAPRHALEIIRSGRPAAVTL